MFRITTPQPNSFLRDKGRDNMQATTFYIRVVIDEIPEDKRTSFAFKEDRNYPVLSADPEKNRILIHDDQNRLLWIPMAVCRFVKLA
jgi:hypothetical protein